MVFDDIVPSLDSPEALAAFRAVATAKTARTQLSTDSILGHREYRVDAPLAALPPDFVWYSPGLAYVLARMDRSVFKLYAANLGYGLQLPTVVCTTPVLTYPEAGEQHAWYTTVQGLDPQHQEPFEAFMASLAVRSGAMILAEGFAAVSYQLGSVTLRALCPRRKTTRFTVNDGGHVAEEDYSCA